MQIMMLVMIMINYAVSLLSYNDENYDFLSESRASLLAYDDEN